MQLRKVLRRGREGTMSQDEPHHADEYHLQLQLGDVIVSGSDGVFDNLFNHEILALIKSYKTERYEMKKHGYVEGSTQELPCILSTSEEANELARRIAVAARSKVTGDYPPAFIRNN